MEATGFFHSTSTAYCRCQWEVILAIQDIRVQQGNGSLKKRRKKKKKKKAIFSLLLSICISEMSGWFKKIKQHMSGMEGVLCAVFCSPHILSFMRCSTNSTFKQQWLFVPHNFQVFGLAAPGCHAVSQEGRRALPTYLSEYRHLLRASLLGREVTSKKLSKHKS